MQPQTLCLLALCMVLCATSSASTVQPWSIEHPNAALWPIDQDVWDMVSNMTLAQKVGQMTQMDITTILKPNSLEIDQSALDNLVENYFIGSVLNSPMSSGPVAGVPNPTPELWQQWITQIQNTATAKGSRVPILYGLDSVHGANYIHGAALFPQQIGAAATFNRSTVELMGAITAKDTRAVGIPWTFSPILGIMTHPLWPRVYETFGEDPYLVSEMGEAIIRGYQGDPFQLNSTNRVAACMKHFIGYPATRSGQDRSPSWVPDRILNQYYVPSFRAAIQRAGVRTGMESYNEINGVPVVASHQYLVDMLRNQLGFNGMLVTDWGEIADLFGLHLVADSLESAVQMSINRTSIDMSMTATDPQFAPLLVSLVQKGLVAQDRVDESAARVLQLKKDLGLFTNPTPFNDEGHADRIRSIGSDQDRAAALDACHQSVTLVQNNGVLPLPTDLHSAPRGLLVSGPSAASIALLAGGWSIHWQGALSDSEFAFGSTILQGVTAYATAAGKPVIYEAGSDIFGNYTDESIQAAVTAAQKTDLTIVAIGEPPYAERIGNIDSIELPYGLQKLVSALVEANATVVLVIVQGRLRTFSHLEPLLPRVAAVLYAYLPGPEGGNCIADILFGVNPSGRLPVSYPGSISKLPMTYFHKNTESPNFLWPFGHGLSYSTFAYSQLQVSPSTVLPGSNVSVSVTVTNSGPLDGAHSVLMFLRDNVREVTPEAALLKGFQKIHLTVGQSATVQFTITTDDLAYYGIDPAQTVIESGTFTVTVGDLTEQFVLALESSPSSALSPPEQPVPHSARDRTRLAPRILRNRFFR